MLKNAGVEMLGGCAYERVDDDGLTLTAHGETRTLAVDHVVICAGQTSRRELEEPLRAKSVSVHLIGGADEAGELDAKRAIAQGMELAATL
jgi:2,4-dienoyl-CoA reductase (NADPH2)